MKPLILIAIINCLALTFGQTALPLEQKIPNWRYGQMTLYFDLAIHPDIMPDGSFSFSKTMSEDIAFWLEHDKAWPAEDMFAYCFDDQQDQLDVSSSDVNFWYFDTARLNARTDGSDDGIVQLQLANGQTLGFMYADSAVLVKGRCQLSEDRFVEINLDLTKEVRYVQIENSAASKQTLVFTTSVLEETVKNAVWVATLK